MSEWDAVGTVVQSGKPKPQSGAPGSAPGVASGDDWDSVGEIVGTAGPITLRRHFEPSQPQPPEMVQDPSKYLSLPQVAAGSMMRDPAQEMEYYAKQAGVPLRQLELKGGEIGLRGDDGQLYQLRPPGVAGWVAKHAGELPAAIGGTLGALKRGHPVLGGMAGTAVGDIGRQMTAQALGEDLGWIDRLTHAAAEQGYNLAGEATGRLMARSIGAGKQYNLGRKLSNETLSDARNLIQKARRFGLTGLTPGEATNMMSLRNLERTLQRTGWSDEVVENFLNIRNPQIEQAVMNTLEELSLDAGLEAAGIGAREASQQAIAAALKEAQDAAAPLYRQALNMGATPDVMPVIRSLNNRMFRRAIGTETRKELQTIKTMLMPEGKPEQSMNKLHSVFVHINENVLDNDNISRATKREVLAVKNRLLAKMNTATDGIYGQAVRTYHEGMPALTALEKGVIGQIAGRQDTTVHTIANSLFGAGSSPGRVAAAREVIEAQNPEAWSSLLRAHLQNAFMKVTDVGVSEQNVGKVFQRVTAGNKLKRGILEAAMSPEQFKNYTDLMDVLEATGRSFTSGESITAFAQQVQKQLEGETAGVGRAVLRGLSIANVTDHIADYWAGISAGRYARELAELVTSPDGLAAVSKWNVSDPKSRKAAVELFRYLWQGGTAVGEQPDDMTGLQEEQRRERIRKMRERDEALQLYQR